MTLIENIQNLLNEVGRLKADNEKELEELRIKYLSKKGIVTELMKDFRNVSNEEKRETGICLNKLKTEAQNKINELREQLQSKASTTGTTKLDLTRTAYPFLWAHAILLLSSRMKSSTSSPAWAFASPMVPK